MVTARRRGTPASPIPHGYDLDPAGLPPEAGWYVVTTIEDRRPRLLVWELGQWWSPIDATPGGAVSGFVGMPFGYDWLGPLPLPFPRPSGHNRVG